MLIYLVDNRYSVDIGILFKLSARNCRLMFSNKLLRVSCFNTNNLYLLKADFCSAIMLKYNIPAHCTYKLKQD